MCLELQLPDMQSISKDDMIKSVSDTILSVNYNNTSSVLVMIVNEEEKDESLISLTIYF